MPPTKFLSAMDLLDRSGCLNVFERGQLAHAIGVSVRMRDIKIDYNMMRLRVLARALFVTRRSLQAAASGSGGV